MWDDLKYSDQRGIEWWEAAQGDRFHPEKGESFQIGSDWWQRESNEVLEANRYAKTFQDRIANPVAQSDGEE